MTNEQESKYKWLIITLSGFTAVFTITMPSICMPVLFQEISNEMGLSLVELGAIWGMGGLAGILTTFAGGLIGDRFGTKRTLAVACILAGIAGASRGFSVGFISLAITMFFFGFFTRTMSLNLHKTAGVWFSGRQVVIANGIVSTGFGFGFMSGAMISDTFLSPLLGGWRNVLFLYGCISVVIGIIWGFTKKEPSQSEASRHKSSTPFHKAVKGVLWNKSVWLLALTQLCYTGCTIGFIGYLPLYLRGIGWTGVQADGALTALTGAGMAAAIPLSLLAGRMDSKKTAIIPIMIISFICICLMSVMNNQIVWPLVIIIGLFRDGYYAIIATMVIETEGIGGAYAGTATGVVWTLGAFGSFIAPPLGNSLASINPGMPFIFWGSMLILPLFLFYFFRDQNSIKREGLQV